MKPGAAGLPGLVGLADIDAARRGLAGLVRRTPVLPVAVSAADLGEERLLAKAECFQITGAFKPRAAFTVVQSLTPDARAKGVVLISSGNFAQAFALAGRMWRFPVVVVMLERTSPYKIAATRNLGAEIVFCARAEERQSVAEQLGRERGLTVVDTWEHPLITAGHGSIGLEILEDVPDVQTVLVPVSSGGLAAGVATAIKLTRPEVRVIGVQPVGADAARRSLKRGKPVSIRHWDSIADGLSAVRPGTYPFKHLKRYLDDLVLVTDDDIALACRVLLLRAKILAEPAGAVATAAFLTSKSDQSRKSVAIVSGGNVSPQVLSDLLSSTGSAPRGAT